MKRRMPFLLVAGALLSSLAFAAPCQAGTEYMTVALFHDTSGTAANDLEVVLSGITAGSISDVVATVNVSGVTATSNTSSDGIQLNFSSALPNLGGYVTLTFESQGLPTFAMSLWTFNGMGPVATEPVFTQTSALTAVPEPRSMCLFGIGITGLLAFHRLFKRPLRVTRIRST